MKLSDRFIDMTMDLGGKAYAFGRNRSRRRQDLVVNMGSSKASRPDSHPVDYWSLMKELRGTYMQRAIAAETSTWVMRCIGYRVNEMHNIEWNILDRNGEKVPNPDKHPFSLLYKHAYQEYDQDIIERWMMMRLCHGMVFFEKFTRPDGLPGGGIVLNSTFMRPKMHSINEIEGYEYHNGHEVIDYELDELLIDTIHGYLSDIRGKAPLDRAMMNINIDLFNQRTIRSFLLNDNQPGMIIRPNNRHGRGISEDSLKLLVKSLKEQREGPENAYTTSFLSHPVEVTTVDSQKPDTLLADDARKAICVEFGIDPAVLGVSMTADPLGASTTLQEKRIITLIDVIKPDMRRFERLINEKMFPWLLKDMSGGRGGRDMRHDRFCWDYMAIDTMIKYTKEALEQAQKHHGEGVISTNEFRNILSLPKVPGGDLMHPVRRMEAEKIRRIYELYSIANAITKQELREILGFMPYPSIHGAYPDEITPDAMQKMREDVARINLMKEGGDKEKAYIEAGIDAHGQFSVDPKRYHVLQHYIDKIEGKPPIELKLSQIPALVEGISEDMEVAPEATQPAKSMSNSPSTSKSESKPKPKSTKK